MTEYYCKANSVYYNVIRYAVKRHEIPKLKSKKYREKIREALLAKYPGKFCDYKNDYHVCQDKDLPLKEPIQETLINNIFNNKN